jgi:hypothetical protein
MTALDELAEGVVIDRNRLALNFPGARHHADKL